LIITDKVNTLHNSAV